MRVYTLSLLACLAIGVLLAGCGGASSLVPQYPGNIDTGNSGGYDLTIPTGPGMPQVAGDDIQLTDDGKIVSNVYRKFFADAVNQNSWGRWNAIDQSGYKAWTLSNIYNSAPKGFLLGGNYWNRESDYLFSNNFIVPDQTDGVRVTFTSRWRIAPGDSCTVIYNTPTGPQVVAMFTGGENPSYPAWDKYYYELPGNFSGDDDDNALEFYFSSDTSLNDWGFAFDDVAVYQRQLEPINDLSASDGLAGVVTVTWTDNNAGTLVPDEYEIWRSDFPGGPYSFLATVPYGGPYSYDDATAPFFFYYYIVRSRKAGWPDSANSNEDLGFSN